MTADEGTKRGPAPGSLPIFITWAGSLSQDIAAYLHKWIPDVIQTAETFFSTESIRKGQLWLVQIGARLTASSFGVAVVTREGMSSPWMHFEVGAIVPKAPAGQVATLLVDVDHSELPGILPQLHATKIDVRDDVLRLVRDINAATAAPIETDRLRRQFDRAWPELEKAVKDARDKNQAVPPPIKAPSEQALEELLNLTREQTRALAQLETRVLQRNIVERLRGPGVAQGPLRKHIQELHDAAPALVTEEMMLQLGFSREHARQLAKQFERGGRRSREAQNPDKTDTGATGS